jgi:hypothetical protein
MAMNHKAVIHELLMATPAKLLRMFTDPISGGPYKETMAPNKDWAYVYNMCVERLIIYNDNAIWALVTPIAKLKIKDTMAAQIEDIWAEASDRNDLDRKMSLSKTAMPPQKLQDNFSSWSLRLGIAVRLLNKTGLLTSYTLAALMDIADVRYYVLAVQIIIAESRDVDTISLICHAVENRLTVNTDSLFVEKVEALFLQLQLVHGPHTLYFKKNAWFRQHCPNCITIMKKVIS